MHGGYDNPFAFAIHFVEIFFLEEIKFTYFMCLHIGSKFFKIDHQ